MGSFSVRNHTGNALAAPLQMILSATVSSPSMYVVSFGMSRSGLSFRACIKFIEPVFLMIRNFTCTWWTRENALGVTAERLSHKAT